MSDSRTYTEPNSSPSSSGKPRSRGRLAAALGSVLLLAGLGLWAASTGRLAGLESMWGGAGDTEGPARPAPRVKLKDASGKARSLEEFRGNIVLVHFWASWCPPCIPELPEFLHLGESVEGKRVKLVAISTDEKWEDAAKLIPSPLASGVSMLWDPESEAADQFGTYQYPETYVLDGELRIVAKWVGPQEWSSPLMSQFLERALTLLDHAEKR
jgi:peroxiredoxin